MTHITAKLVRSVEEEFEVAFRGVSGDFIKCADYLKKELDFAGRTKANKLLRNPGERFYLGDYYNCMDLIGRFSRKGIHCELIQVKESPWNDYSDEQIEKIMFWSEWTNLSIQQKEKWLTTLRLLHCKYKITRYTSLGSVYYLDGKITTDLTSFLIAVGEAVNGPGGYFGACLYGLSDCLSGGFGLADTYIFEWHDSEYAKDSLNNTQGDSELFETICSKFGNSLKCL